MFTGSLGTLKPHHYDVIKAVSYITIITQQHWYFSASLSPSLPPLPAASVVTGRDQGHSHHKNVMCTLLWFKQQDWGREEDRDERGGEKGMRGKGRKGWEGRGREGERGERGGGWREKWMRGEEAGGRKGWEEGEGGRKQAHAFAEYDNKE